MVLLKIPGLLGVLKPKEELEKARVFWLLP
jgi:hypothetical protein